MTSEADLAMSAGQKIKLADIETLTYWHTVLTTMDTQLTIGFSLDAREEKVK